MSNSQASNQDILRNRFCANQESMQGSMARPAGRLPLYYVTTSSGIQASDPNTMRDMGKPRNAVYEMDDELTEKIARSVTWRQILEQDQELNAMAS